MEHVHGIGESYRIHSPIGVAPVVRDNLQNARPFAFPRLCAGVLAAKKTSDLIPLCHPLPLTNVEVNVNVADKGTVSVTAIVKTKAQTGVEMEALTAVSVALLTVWDMTKQYEKDSAGQYPSTAIENIHVVRKFKQA